MQILTIRTTVVGLALMTATVYGSTPRANRSQRFPVSQTLHVPGATLTPGTYSIKELDHLADRSIVQVESADGKVHASFVAIPSTAIARPAKAGPVLWSSAVAGESYVRGWAFPNDSAVFEFAYPKGEAVTIAKSEQSGVAAVDPESEHMQPVADATASRSDMEVINLWLLSADRVGGAEPEIKAARYQATASDDRKPVVTAKKLPKTASELPLVAIAGLAFLGLAGAVRYTRKPATSSNRNS